MLIKPISFWQQPIVAGGAPPATQYIYLCGYNFYQWKDTRLGLAGTGGIAKIDLTGSLDTTWTTNANPSGQTEVRFFTPLNGNTYGDTRNTTGGQLIKKWDSSGNIIASASVGNTVWSMNALEGSTFFMIGGDKGVTYGGTTINGVGKINEDLTRDTTFTTNIGTAGAGGSPSGFITNTHITADKIAVMGRFTSFNSYTNSDRFVVLNYDGTRDTTFNRSGSFFGGSSAVNAAIWIDNKWIIAGTFISYGGVSHNRILALNADGSINSTFTTNIGTACNGSISRIYKVNDTQVIITGAFTTFNGNSRSRIALLNTDGTLPANIFGSGINAPAVYTGLDSNGKIYLSGAPPLSGYNSYTSRNFFPVNSDGTINSTFITGSAMRTSAGIPATAEAGGLFVR